VVSHAIGLGEIIDAVALVVGVASVGWAIFNGLDDLYEFATGVYHAQTSRDIDRAADCLARAIGVLGVQAVLAVLFRGAKLPRTAEGGRFELHPAPRSGGIRYKPTITTTTERAAGSGFTTEWGDIVVSSRGTATDRALVALHEKVHQFLAPKFYFMREYRVGNRLSSYVRSSLYRYIEEAAAETVAQVGVNGFREFFTGMTFPVKNGYMYLRKAGGAISTHYEGIGLIPEAKAVLWVGVASGVALELCFVPGTPRRTGQSHLAGTSHTPVRVR
jgi:hypothetical protein